MSFLGNKNKRQYVAAGVFLFLVICLMLFLTYIDIPAGNKDLIVSIVAMLVGRASVATDTLFGGGDAELDDLRHRMDVLEQELKVERAQHHVTKAAYDALTALIVNRVEIAGVPVTEAGK